MTDTDAPSLATAVSWQALLSAPTPTLRPSLFNFEWLIDKAERGDWSGLWW